MPRLKPEHLGPRVIGLGFQKTGTTTLREALRILGYNPKDWVPGVFMPVLRGNIDQAIWRVRKYDALEDLPWYIIYRELDQRLPGSKFILTLRDEESWFKSVSRHIGDLRSAHHEWVYGRGKGIPSEDKANALRVYREHIAGVREYFRDRPDDLLEIDWSKGDGWEKLCPFLGKAIPDQSIPHENRINYQDIPPDPAIRRMRKRIKQSIRIKYIDALGLWKHPYPAAEEAAR